VILARPTRLKRRLGEGGVDVSIRAAISVCIGDPQLKPIAQEITVTSSVFDGTGISAQRTSRVVVRDTR